MKKIIIIILIILTPIGIFTLFPEQVQQVLNWSKEEAKMFKTTESHKEVKTTDFMEDLIKRGRQ